MKIFLIACLIIIGVCQKFINDNLLDRVDKLEKYACRGMTIGLCKAEVLK